MKKHLIAFALVLLAGCVIFPPENRYELFSYIPSEGAEGAVFVDLKENAFSELSSLLGTLLGGGKLRNIKGMQVAFVGYEDGGSAGVIQFRTDMGVDDILEALPYGETKLTNETKWIGGREVVLLYQEYDTKKENPLCMWREGEWLRFVYYQEGYKNATSRMRCDTILEQRYDTKKVEELLSESMAMREKVAPTEKLFGEGAAYIENQSIYVSVLGDGVGDYGVMITKGGRKGAALCYNDSSTTWSEVVRRGNKRACVKEYEGGSYPLSILSKMSFIYAERRVGEYSVLVFALPKESKTAARSKAEDMVFGVELEGEEAEWKDRMKLTVKVVERADSQSIPVADAKVELYSYYPYEIDVLNGGYGKRVLRTGYTDDRGVVDFENLPIANYNIEVSKPGYTTATRYVYPTETQPISITLKQRGPLIVTVVDSNRTPVAEARVELYNRTESYEYKLIRTLYTDEKGVASFGRAEVEYGKLVVSKEGYRNSTQYVYSSTTNITVSLTREVVYNYTGQPFTVTVRSYNPFGGLDDVEEAKVSIYNKTSTGYVLAFVNYTDSKGVARLSGGGIADGRIDVEKSGYENFSQYFYYYNGRNMMVYLTSLNASKIYGYDKLTGENCAGNFAVRIWPSEAATATCTDSSGNSIPSTGPNSAEWFNYGGCGGWKTYNVTPGSQIKIHAYGDACDGCSLWHINFYLHDYYNSSWHNVGYVDGPDERGAVYDFCYTPKGDRISIEAETGFYVQVFAK